MVILCGYKVRIFKTMVGIKFNKSGSSNGLISIARFSSETKIFRLVIRKTEGLFAGCAVDYDQNGQAEYGDQYGAQDGGDFPQCRIGFLFRRPAHILGHDDFVVKNAIKKQYSLSEEEAEQCL